MSRTIPAGLQEALEEPIISLAYCLWIQRTDGAEFAMTSHQEDIPLDGVTYLADPGIAPVSLDMTAGMSPDDLQVTGFLSPDGINRVDIFAGDFDNARAKLFLVDWSDPTLGAIQLPVAFLTDINAEDLTWTARLVGLSVRLQERYARVYTPLCHAMLGDAECKVDLDGTGALDQALKASGAVVELITDRMEITSNVLGYTAEDGTGPGIPTEPPTTHLVNIVSDQIHCVYHGAPILPGFTQRYVWSSLLWAPGATNPWYKRGITDGMIINVSGSSKAINNANWRVSHVWDAEQGRRLWLRGYQEGHPYMADVWVYGQDTLTITDVIAEGVSSPDTTAANYTPSPWWAHGILTWTSGENQGRRGEIRDYDPQTGRFALYLPTPFEIKIGDQFEVVAGCDRRRGTCMTKFSNLDRFRGFPDVAGPGRIGDYPDRHDVKVG